jgi:hypothetical protein
VSAAVKFNQVHQAFSEIKKTFLFGLFSKFSTSAHLFFVCPVIIEKSIHSFSNLFFKIFSVFTKEEKTKIL